MSTSSATGDKNGFGNQDSIGQAGLDVSSMSRADLVKKFAVSSGDTGSPEVQVALLTKDLAKLSKHFSGHSQDLHSQRGLMAKVGRRKKLLDYLKRENVERYRSLINTLGLRK